MCVQHTIIRGTNHLLSSKRVKQMGCRRNARKITAVACATKKKPPRPLA